MNDCLIYFPLLWRASKSSQKQVSVIFVLLLLVSLDWLMFVFFGTVIQRISTTVWYVWLLVPFLAQPLAMISGPLFILLESPFVGRLYGALQTFSLISVMSSSVGLFIFLRGESWIFDAGALAVTFANKLAIFILTMIHVRNIELVRDLRSTYASLRGRAPSRLGGRGSTAPSFDRAADDCFRRATSGDARSAARDTALPSALSDESVLDGRMPRPCSKEVFNPSPF